MEGLYITLQHTDISEKVNKNLLKLKTQIQRIIVSLVASLLIKLNKNVESRQHTSNITSDSK